MLLSSTDYRPRSPQRSAERSLVVLYSNRATQLHLGIVEHHPHRPNSHLDGLQYAMTATIFRPSPTFWPNLCGFANSTSDGSCRMGEIESNPKETSNLLAIERTQNSIWSGCIRKKTLRNLLFSHVNGVCWNDLCGDWCVGTVDAFQLQTFAGDALLFLIVVVDDRLILTFDACAEPVLVVVPEQIEQLQEAYFIGIIVDRDHFHMIATAEKKLQKKTMKMRCNEMKSMLV